MLTPDEWEARLTARNRERHIHNIACFDIYGELPQYAGIARNYS